MRRLWLVPFVLAAFICACCVSARAAEAGLLEIVLTDYVGGEDSRTPSPEYIERIVLRRDGRAVYIGNPTYARQRGRYEGRVAPEQFQRLARLLPPSLNFKPSYNKIEGRGLTRATFGMAYSGRMRETIVYEDGMSGEPMALRQARHIVSGLSWRIVWVRSARFDRFSQGMAGIRGFAVRGPMSEAGTLGVVTPKSLAGAVVVLRNSSGREVARGRTDRKGRFAFAVKPGTYTTSLIAPRESGLRPAEEPQKVIIPGYGFTEILFSTRVTP